MKLGYLPNNLSTVAECELYMLPGLKASFDACRIAGITISRLEFGEFQLLEKSQFIDDLKDVFVYNRAPLYCVFSSYETGQGSQDYRSYLRGHSVFRLARALWLLKEGILYNPLDFIHYRRIGMQNLRDSKRYGRLAYNLHVSYELKEEELPILEGIYYAISCFDESRYCCEFDVAAALFYNTFSPALIEPTDSFLLLLGSLEAIAGKNATKLVEAHWITPEQRDFLRYFQMHRNGAAHGKKSVEYKQVSLLREIIRCLLREALVWCLQEPRQEHINGKRLVERLLSSGGEGPNRLASVETAYKPLFVQEEMSFKKHE